MLKYLMLRTLGGCSVYFTCSYAWSSTSSIVTWTDVLSGVRAPIGSVLRKKSLKWEYSRESMQEAQKPRFQLSQCCTVCSFQEGKSRSQNTKWLPVPPELIAFALRECTKALQQMCPCPPVPGRTAQAQPSGFVQHRSDTHDNRDTAEPPLLQRQHLGQSSGVNRCHLLETISS